MQKSNTGGWREEIQSNMSFKKDAVVLAEEQEDGEGDQIQMDGQGLCSGKGRGKDKHRHLPPTQEVCLV